MSYLNELAELEKLLRPIDVVKEIVERRIPHRGMEEVHFTPTIDQLLVDGLRRAWIDGFKHGNILYSPSLLMVFDLKQVKKFESLDDVNIYGGRK